MRALTKLFLGLSIAVSSSSVERVARAEPVHEATPPPIMSSFSPTTGTKGTTVTVTGKNLLATQTVRFFAVSAVITSATDTTLTFVVPDLTPATYPITVVSGNATVSKGGFVVPTATQTALQLAVWMKSAGSSASETATVLTQRSLVSGAGQGIDALNRAGYSATEQAQAAKDAFGKTSAGTAVLLHGVGHSAPSIMTTLKSTFAAAPADAAAACTIAGFTVETTAGALKTVYAQSAPQAASALRAGGLTSIAVAGALKYAYGQGARDVALSLKLARYSEKENYDALVSIFSLTRRQALDVLISVGYTPMSLLGAV